MTGTLLIMTWWKPSIMVYEMQPDGDSRELVQYNFGSEQVPNLLHLIPKSVYVRHIIQPSVQNEDHLKHLMLHETIEVFKELTEEFKNPDNAGSYADTYFELVKFARHIQDPHRT